MRILVGSSVSSSLRRQPCSEECHRAWQSFTAGIKARAQLLLQMIFRHTRLPFSSSAFQCDSPSKGQPESQINSNIIGMPSAGVLPSNTLSDVMQTMARIGMFCIPMPPSPDALARGFQRYQNAQVGQGPALCGQSDYAGRMEGSRDGTAHFLKLLISQRPPSAPTRSQLPIRSTVSTRCASLSLFLLS